MVDKSNILLVLIWIIISTLCVRQYWKCFSLFTFCLIGYTLSSLAGSSIIGLRNRAPIVPCIIACIQVMGGIQPVLINKLIHLKLYTQHLQLWTSHNKWKCSTKCIYGCSIINLNFWLSWLSNMVSKSIWVRAPRFESQQILY